MLSFISSVPFPLDGPNAQPSQTTYATIVSTDYFITHAARLVHLVTRIINAAAMSSTGPVASPSPPGALRHPPPTHFARQGAGLYTYIPTLP